MLLRVFTLLLAVSFPGLIGAEEEYWEYTFRPGDSIWKIAEQYTTSVDNWHEIQKLNKIARGPDRRIRPGTRILIPVSMLKHQPAPAVVIAVSGDARLVRASGEEEVAEVGALLNSGDRVVTAEAQTVRMQFADQSELQVLPDTTVILDKISYHKDTGMVDTRIRLNSGRVRSWVEKFRPDSNSNYEIKTPAAVTAVRGTEFRLSSTSLISRTEVTDGVVGVAAGDVERSVGSGYGIVAEKDKPLPEPVKLLSAPELSDNLSADAGVLKVAWNRLDGADLYRYRLATDPDFNQVIVDSTTDADTIEFSDLDPGRYYLLVRGVDAFKLEGFDATREFDIQAAPEQGNDGWLIPVSVGVMLLVL